MSNGNRTFLLFLTLPRYFRATSYRVVPCLSPLTTISPRALFSCPVSKTHPARAHLEPLQSIFRAHPALLLTLSRLPLTSSACYPPHMPFNSETARAAYCRFAGLRRAAFWRALGFPNLVRAREARARKRARAAAEQASLSTKRPRGF
jgi:hypothetical protein